MPWPSKDSALKPGTYRAPAWLPNGHSQTIWAARIAPRPAIHYRRETWETPDGDRIAVDFAVAPTIATRNTASSAVQAPNYSSAPLVVLFHGLEGDSQSHYARSMMAALHRRGWRGAVVHFRGCGGLENRLPRAYHSGDDHEIDWILRRMHTVAGSAPLHAVGISLGGNALATWAGRRGDDASRWVQSAAVISAPQDLAAGAHALANGFARLYAESFLKTLRVKARNLANRHPGLIDASKAVSARSFFEFDDAVTAPLHGFRDARDYYARSSCRRWLQGVTLPLLVINARNDPFLPESALAPRAEVSSMVTLEYPADGGHVGFPGRADDLPGLRDTLSWLPHRVLNFLNGHG